MTFRSIRSLGYTFGYTVVTVQLSQRAASCRGRLCERRRVRLAAGTRATVTEPAVSAWEADHSTGPTQGFFDKAPGGMLFSVRPSPV